MSGFEEHSFYVERDLKLYYRDYPAPKKNALTVLCLPGLTRSSKDFEDLAPHLAQKYRVLAPDLRGRSQSDYAGDSATYVPVQYVRDIRKLLNHVEVPRAVFIGTSLGGIITMLAAGIMRDKLAGAVLNDIGPVVEADGIARIQDYVGKTASFESWEAAAQACVALGGAVFPEFGPEDWMRFARRTFAEKDGKITPDYDPAIAAPFQRPGAAIPELWPFFEALKGLPVLSIRGGLSDILSAGTVAEMQRRHPKMKTLTLNHVGHTPTLDEPEARAAIDALLGKIPAELGLIRHFKSKYDAIRTATRIMKQVKAGQKPAAS